MWVLLTPVPLHVWTVPNDRLLLQKFHDDDTHKSRSSGAKTCSSSSPEPRAHPASDQMLVARVAHSVNEEGTCAQGHTQRHKHTDASAHPSVVCSLFSRLFVASFPAASPLAFDCAPVSMEAAARGVQVPTATAGVVR